MSSLAFSFENESLRIALKNIVDRRLRSLLTIGGIAIGIAAVVALVSTGIGATEFIKEQLNSFGGNKIFIAPASFLSGGGGFGPPSSSLKLTDQDLDAISKINGIDVVGGIFIKSLTVNFNSQILSMSIFGGGPDQTEKLFKDVQGFELESGRFLKKGDKFSAVIGPVIASKMFSKDIGVGNKIKIGGESFKVVGITKSTGQQDNDNLLIVPIQTLRDLSGEKDSYTIMLANVNNINKVQEIADAVQKKMDKIHGEKVFSVLTAEKLASNISSIFTSLSVLLSGIAGISLLVAAVGISNTMLMSVLERTREIGIMKAVGASNYNVMELFLTESALIGLFGGVAGVTIGSIGAVAINTFSSGTGFALKTSVPLYLIAGGLLIALLVGITSGLWPARRAAKLNPVDALRYQ